MEKEYQAVILVGGLGTRLRPVTEEVPKPMVEIEGRPFLEFKIESLKKYGIKDFIFCVGHLGHVVEEYFGDGKRFGVNIEYSYEKEGLLGTAGAIKNAEHLIKGDFISMNGDTYLDIDIEKLLNFHENHSEPFTMVVCDASHAKTQELVELDNVEVKTIHKRDTKEHEDYLAFADRPLVNGGMYVMSKGVLESIPIGKKVSLEQEIFPAFISKMKGFLHKGYMLDVADENDWGEFRKDVREGLILPGICNRKKIIRSRAPVRITFGGGGTDIDPYDKMHGGICINAAINRYVYSSLKMREDKKIKIKSDIVNIQGGFETYEQSFENIDEVSFEEDGPLKIIKAIILEMQPGYGFELYVRSEVPPNSGLGASASLCVSVIGVLNQLRKKRRLTRHEIAELSWEIESHKLGEKGGRQDQYAAAFGGINLFEFKGESNVKVNKIDAIRDHLLELEKNLLVVWSGRRAVSSGQIHKEEFKNFDDKKDKIKRLHNLKDVAIEMEFNLRRGNLKKFGELILDGWENKKKFNPIITNTYIDALVEEAVANGALGVKLMGAGGGGHLLIYSKPDQEHKIREVLAERGAKSIDFSFDFEGLKVWEVEENEF